MTTVRKWGVRYRDAFQNCIWRGPNHQPDTVDLDKAFLWESPIEAAWLARETDGRVREVLVTQEAGGWELDTTVTHVSLALRDCVVTVRPKAGGCHRFVTDDYQSTRQQHLAVVHQRVDRAFAHAVEAARRHSDCWVEVFSIRRTEPREVRRAGRTLDEILASVPVEVPSDE